MNRIARFTCFSAFFIGLLVWNIAGRSLQHDRSYKQVSDGVDSNSWRSLLLFLKGSNDSEEECEQMYGFLPCSRHTFNQVFLILVYEYLLYWGEYYAGGDGRIFGVLGKNLFSAFIFQLLDSLPDSIILLVFGLRSSEEETQVYILTGAGLLAGSTIYLLTIVWGLCICYGRVEFDPRPGTELGNKCLQLLTDSGVVTNKQTTYHAKVMFFSLVPFFVILLPRSVFDLSYSSQEYKTVILVTLCVSVMSLIAYFIYQLIDEHIPNSILAYAEFERKAELHIPFYDVRDLVQYRQKQLIAWEKVMEESLKHVASNDREIMTRGEFFHTFGDWLEKTTQLMDAPYNEVAKLLIEDRYNLIKEIFLAKRLSWSGKTLIEHGTQNEDAIDRFFEMIDTNMDGLISNDELEHFIMEVELGRILVDDKVAEIIMKHLGVDGNENIDKHQFKSGFRNWFNKISHEASSSDKRKPHNNQETNRHTDLHTKIKEGISAVFLLLVGICMMSFFAEPLVESVREFSESMKFKPYYVSFIVIPIASNARTTVATVYAVSHKNTIVTSSTLAEIYHKVFVNNVLGFTVLLTIIYCRGLTWRFSAEISVMIIVCVIMGFLTSTRTRFPIWIVLIAIFLYPLSWFMAYVWDSSWAT